MNNKTKSIIIVCFWLILAVFLIIVNEKIFLFGKTINLNVRPIDPNDPLRGQYVLLKYDISEINTKNPIIFKRDDLVFVTLYKKPGEGNIYDAKEVSLQKPENNEPYIKGRIHRIYTKYDKHKPETKLYIKYGIENFFTNQNEAKRLERELLKNGGIAEVTIDSRGNARVRDVK